MKTVDYPVCDAHTHFVQTHYALLNYHLNDDSLFDSAFFSVGLHPWYCEGWTEQSILQSFEKILQNRRPNAIGEAGLDRLRGPALERQMDAFLCQAHIAVENHLPLIIHSVRTVNEIIQCKKMVAGSDWVFHSFNLKQTQADALLDQGFFLSFGRAILTPGSAATKALLHCPPSRLLLESDDAPHSIDDIFIAAAEIRKVSVEQMREEVLINWKHLFLAEK